MIGFRDERSFGKPEITVAGIGPLTGFASASPESSGFGTSALTAGVTLRSDISTCLVDDRYGFRAGFPDLVDRHGLAARIAAFEEDIDAFDGPPGRPGYERLDPWTRELIWRLWLLDDTPLGLALSGPAYQGNPIQYVTRAFRRLTGCELANLLGANPRLLQGPDTESAAVADLREATTIWEPVTVELRNYRSDGTPFTNRVSLVPIGGPDGAVSNWLEIQERIDGD